MNIIPGFQLGYLPAMLNLTLGLSLSMNKPVFNLLQTTVITCFVFNELHNYGIFGEPGAGCQGEEKSKLARNMKAKKSHAD